MGYYNIKIKFILRLVFFSVSLCLTSLSNERIFYTNKSKKEMLIPSPCKTTHTHTHTHRMLSAADSKTKRSYFIANPSRSIQSSTWVRVSVNQNVNERTFQKLGSVLGKMPGNKCYILKIRYTLFIPGGKLQCRSITQKYCQRI